MPTRSFPDFAGVASRPPQDDHLSVLFGLNPPWRLSLDAGRWLRRMNAAYEDQLALCIFVRAVPVATTLPTAQPHDALLRRLRRLRLPSGLVFESRHGPAGDAAFAEWRSFSRWTRLQAVNHDAEPRASTALSGLVVRSRFYRPDGPNPLPDAPYLVDFSAAVEGWADQASRIASLADGLAANPEGRIAGVIIDGLDPFMTTPQMGSAHAVRTLDLLANAVEHRRLALATRRPRSLWSRL